MNDLDRASQRIAELRDENVMLNEKIEKLLVRNKELVEKADGLGERNVALRDQLDSARNALEEQDETIRTLLTEKEALEGQIVALKEIALK